MFSFYRLIEALDKLQEEIGGDVAGVGIPSSSGVSAAGAINPPESPAKKKILSIIKTKDKESDQVKPAEKDLKGPV